MNEYWPSVRVACEEAFGEQSMVIGPFRAVETQFICAFLQTRAFNGQRSLRTTYSERFHTNLI